MNKSHTVRIRDEAWDHIEKHTWKLSNEAKKMLKTSDIINACLMKYLDKLTYEDIERIHG